MFKTFIFTPQIIKTLFPAFYDNPGLGNLIIFDVELICGFLKKDLISGNIVGATGRPAMARSSRPRNIAWLTMSLEMCRQE